MTNANRKLRSRLLASAFAVASVAALALTLGAVVGCAPTTAHDGVAYNDVPAEEATVVSVDPATCQDPACHGTLEEMAVKTADLDTFKDEKGKVQNPHDYESNGQHDAHQPVCTDCHKINGRFARPRHPSLPPGPRAFRRSPGTDCAHSSLSDCRGVNTRSNISCLLLTSSFL